MEGVAPRRTHAEEDGPKETEVQKLRRKRHTQEGRQGCSVSKVWRERHQAVNGTDHAALLRQERPPIEGALSRSPHHDRSSVDESYFPLDYESESVVEASTTHIWWHTA